MKQNFSVSIRLRTIAANLPKKANFADIGSDHAYLPCYVCLHDKDAKAVAGEVVEGPFNSAIATVKDHQLDHAIDVRLGDGLAVLDDNEVKQIVIAGMGGSLITSILEEGKEKLGTVERIIAQPNGNAKAVRKWIYQCGYVIIQEELIEENGHFYEIIVADRMNEHRNLTEKEFMFGPILLVTKSQAFYNKWKGEQAKLLHVINQLEQANEPQPEKRNRFHKELTWVKEALQDEGQASKS